MTKSLAQLPSIPFSSTTHRVRLDQCLEEVTKGVGPSWHKYRLIGATRGGLAPAKEGVGKNPERYKPVEPGTIFYNPMRILLGSIAFVDEGEEPGITSPDYVVFKGKTGVLHPRWFYYWLRSDDGAAFIKTLTRGAVRERMLFRRLASAEIELPSYNAQLRFAQQMPAIERARDAAKAQLEAAKALPAAYLRTVFDSPEARKWPRKPLGSIATRISKGESPGWQGHNYVQSGIRFVRSENVLWGTFSKEPQTFIPPEFHAKLSRSALNPGNVLVNLVGASIGRACAVPGDIGEANVNQAVAVISLDGSLLPDCLVAFIVSPEVQDYFRGVQVEVARPNISLENLRDLQVPIPSVERQQRLSAQLALKVAGIKSLSTTLQQQCYAINHLPAVLLRQAFNGEL